MTICAIVREINEEMPPDFKVPIDSGVTRTDFSNPQKPVARFIGPDGQFTNGTKDSIETEIECYQAAIRLAELAQRKPPGLKPARAEKLFRHFDTEDMRVFWLEHDVQTHEKGLPPTAAMEAFFAKADEVWEKTADIKNIESRKKFYISVPGTKNIFLRSPATPNKIAPRSKK